MLPPDEVVPGLIVTPPPTLTPSWYWLFFMMPVISIIVYPFPTTVAESPFSEMSGNVELLQFHFQVLCLWQLEAEYFVQERLVSMYALLPTMRGANEHLLSQAIDELIQQYKGNDAQIAQQLKADFYFAHPYASWERGTNEKTNGLVRQYFPKKSDFSKITDRQVNRVVERLNNRPRKTLGYKTPNEVFFKLPLVALTT